MARKTDRNEVWLLIVLFSAVGDLALIRLLGFEHRYAMPIPDNVLLTAYLVTHGFVAMVQAASYYRKK